MLSKLLCPVIRKTRKKKKVDERRKWRTGRTRLVQGVVVVVHEVVQVNSQDDGGGSDDHWYR